MHIFALLVLILLHVCVHVDGMFRELNWLDTLQTSQKNYGIAASDVNNDGRMDWIVAGYKGRNFVLTYDPKTRKLKNIAKRGTPYQALMDRMGHAIGVCACDIDGDGREEIYFVNTNNAFAGRATYPDKLFKWRNGSYVDLFSDPANRDFAPKMYSGRSVACVDRMGTGRYAFAVATYYDGKEGNVSLIEMNAIHPENNVMTGFVVLRDSAEAAGISKGTGGRGIAVGPIMGNHGASDLFFVNEGNNWIGTSGRNFLFENFADGTFVDIAKEVGVDDANGNGRGVSLADFNDDGLIDIVYGNWKGSHKIYMHYLTPNYTTEFRDEAPTGFSEPSPARTVMVNDFDNDGFTEVFFNNICGRHRSDRRQPNHLFRVKKSSGGVNQPSISVTNVDIGEALEPYGCGTGGSYADMDGDGKLDVLLSHGEITHQALSVYTSFSASNDYIRVFPKTVYGAPARGSTVTLTLRSGRHITQIIDGGSGYLCQMEPIAHFGLGRSERPLSFHIQWPDGRTYFQQLSFAHVNRVHVVGWGRSEGSG